MTTTAGRWAFLVATLLSVNACAGPTSPAAPASTPAVSAPNPPVPIPPNPPVPPIPPIPPGVAPSAGTYVFVDTGTRASSYTRASRWVLSEDGRFALEYPSYAYPGSYTHSPETGLITFIFGAKVIGTRWDAMGSVRNDVLTIVFSDMMHESDFEDASYQRVE